MHRRYSIDNLIAAHNTGMKIALYGAGNAGEAIYNILKKCGVYPDLFIDNDEKKQGTIICDDVNCVAPHDIIQKENIILIISVSWSGYNSLYKKAQEDGFINFFELSDVLDDVFLNHRDLLKDIFSFLFEYKPTVDIIIPSGISGIQHTGLGCSEILETKDKICVYTGLFGDYDVYHKPQVYPENIDYYFISDNQLKDCEPVYWINARQVIPEEIASPILRNRYIKMHAADIFPGYKYAIYVDANLEIVEDLSKLLHKCKSGISVFTHYNRDCLFYEALQIVNFKRIIWSDAYNQVIKYLSEGMPLHYGLGEMPVIVMDLTNSICKKVMKEWWIEFEKGALRDQLSFMYVIWKNGLSSLDITSLGNDYRFADEFVFYTHILPSLLKSKNEET